VNISPLEGLVRCCVSPDKTDMIEPEGEHHDGKKGCEQSFALLDRREERGERREREREST
jgi:hypothetical protein